MSNIIDRYFMGLMAGAGGLIALTLTGVLLMTQSLRFLELIIESGASGLAFITLSLLALPRFFEVILPVSLSAAALFIFLRLRREGEIQALQAAGATPFRLIRSGLWLSVFVGAVLFVMMAVVAPMTLASMHQMSQLIKNQYANLLFRDGVFNSIGDDVTVYVASREGATLKGLMIYDGRPENRYPVTVLAREGQLIITDQGQKVVVYHGQRQSFNPQYLALEKLSFEKYVIDLPSVGPMEKRWAEPEERSLWALMFPPPSDTEARMKYPEFRAELHRRLMAPALAPCFFLVTATLFLLAPFGRTRSAYEMIWTFGAVIGLQALYIAAFSWAKHSLLGILLMYGIVLVPLGICLIYILRQSAPLPEPREGT